MSGELSSAMKYYFKNQKKLQKYQLDYYYKNKERLNERRREIYAKNNPFCNPYKLNNYTKTIIIKRGKFEIQMD